MSQPHCFFGAALGLGGDSPAVVDDRGVAVSYAALDEEVAGAAATLESIGPRQFGFLMMANDRASLVAYLGALRAGHVPLLLPRELAPTLLDPMLQHYRPAWIMRSGIGSLEVRTPAPAAALHPELALLLTTSGTTGSPKLVRLSARALQSNASSIANYLELGPGERALTVLPTHYSYGLSVVNSHLASYGCLVLRNTSVLAAEFVNLVRDHAVTSLSGVPTTYQMLYRSGFQRQDLPSLRSMTQAGGRLDERLTASFSEWAQGRGIRFYVMYGQTEATARISYVPPVRLPQKIGSIGIPIPGGGLEIDPAVGELIYRGDNVMLGYAQTREDLARGDELMRVLRTGDTGHRDDEGYFYVTGRLKRMLKMAGNRVSLDEVESHLIRELAAPVAVAGSDDRLEVWVASAAPGCADAARQLIGSVFGLHHSLVRARQVDALPVLASGKTDYAALSAPMQ